MKIPKDEILKLIESRMGHDHAKRAAAELPDDVDHEQHAGLLSKFGLDPQELLKLVGGAGGLGGTIGGMLGGDKPHQGAGASEGDAQSVPDKR